MCDGGGDGDGDDDGWGFFDIGGGTGGDYRINGKSNRKPEECRGDRRLRVRSNARYSKRRKEKGRQ